jgi:hypothetical protein
LLIKTHFDLGPIKNVHAIGNLYQTPAQGIEILNHLRLRACLKSPKFPENAADRSLKVVKMWGILCTKSDRSVTLHTLFAVG